MSRPKKRDCLKHFYSYPDGRPTTRWGDEERAEVPRSFSGWLSDIITAGPSLLVFSLVLSQSHFLLRESCLPFSFARSFSRRHESLLPPSYFVSRHCPFQPPWDCGANTAGYRINFLSRGCRDFTLLERRRWGGSRRSQKPPRLLRSRGPVLWLGVEIGMRVKSSREEN